MSVSRRVFGWIALVAALMVVLAGCEFFRSGYDHGILILEDGGTEVGVYDILSGADLPVTLAGPYWEFTANRLDGYDVVIFLNGKNYSGRMPAAVQTALRDWVSNGGALLTTEWLMWSGSVNETTTGILPVTYGGTWSTGVETYTREAEHPISANLPASFQTRTDWSFSVTRVDPDPVKDAVVVFSGSRSEDAVVTGRHGSGRVVHWNMGGVWNGTNIWSIEMRTLLVNIAEYLLSDD